MKLTNIRKITLVGDLHLGIKNNSIEWIQIQKDFLLDFLINKVDEDFDEDRDILFLEGGTDRLAPIQSFKVEPNLIATGRSFLSWQ